jgi:hypothetical protein
MIRLILAFLLFALPAYAQQGQAVGPNPPCSAFGTTAGTCLQGNSVPQGAFTPYTPTVVLGQSTGTAVATPSGRYQQTGKRVDLEITVGISGTFTAGIITSITLPVQAVNAVGTWNLAGREQSLSGIVWVGSIYQNGTTLANISTYLNSNTILTGYTLTFTGWYESQ